MTLANVVTASLQVTARSAIRAVLQEADPTLDISIGGAVDSVLVEGNVAVTAQNQVDLATLALSTQLSSIADGTVVVTDAQMDVIAANYFVTRSSGVAAYGPIEFIVTTDKAYTIPAGYRFTVATDAGDVSYTIPSTYTVYASSAAPDLSISTNRQIFISYDSLSGYSNRFVVEAVCSVVGPTGLLSTGTVTVPAQPFNGFARSSASSDFSGGTSAETNAELATRALQGITPAVVLGRANIEKLATTTYTNAKVGVIGAESVLTRPSNNILGISAGGKIDIFVKSGSPTTRALRVSATVVNYTTRLVTLTLPAPYSYGVYSVSATAAYSSAAPVIVSGGVVTTATDTAAVTRADFNPFTTSALDRKFSANTTITLTVRDDRQTSGGYVVAMASNGQAINGIYDVVYEYMPGVTEVAAAIYSKQVMPPGVDAIVKACVPCYVTVIVVASKPANYTGETAAQLIQRIVRLINTMPMGTAALSAFSINNVIATYAPQLVVQSTTLAGWITGQDGSGSSVVAVSSKLTIPTSLTGRYSGDNVGFVTTFDRVAVTLV